MPELPEVEVAARSLRRWAGKKTIRGVRADPKAARLFRPATPKAVEALAGARFGEVRRIGKNLLLTLVPRGSKGTGAPLGVWSHLGMTGKWLRRTAKAPAPPATRLEIELAGGVRLCYVDQRMFGRFRLVPGARFQSIPEIAALGPDPLNDGIDVPSFAKRLARLKLPIKVALLDQTLLAGVGNIQASESLFRARHRPPASGALALAGGGEAARRRHPQIDRLHAEDVRRGGRRRRRRRHRLRRGARHPQSVPGLRPGGRALPWQGIEGRHRPHRPGRPRDFLLPALPELGSGSRTMLAIVFLSSAGVALFVLRRLRFDRRTIAIVLAGVALYADYLTYTSVAQRNYDGLSHVYYIQAIAQNLRLPAMSGCMACGHPPLYYALGAAWSRSVLAGGWMPFELGLQWLSLLLFVGFVVLALLVIRSFEVAPATQWLAAALVVFWPSSVLNSVRVHNDALASPLILAAIYFTARWDSQRHPRDFWLALVASALAILTKASGYVAAATLILFALVHLCTTKVARRDVTRAAIAIVGLGAIAVLAVFSRLEQSPHALCQEVLGHACDGRYKPPVADTPSRFIFFDLPDFIRRMDAMPDYPKPDYFWNRFAKSSLFGVLPLGDDIPSGALHGAGGRDQVAPARHGDRLPRWRDLPASRAVAKISRVRLCGRHHAHLPGGVPHPGAQRVSRRLSPRLRRPGALLPRLCPRRRSGTSCLRCALLDRRRPRPVDDWLVRRVLRPRALIVQRDCRAPPTRRRRALAMLGKCRRFQLEFGP